MILVPIQCQLAPKLQRFRKLDCTKRSQTNLEHFPWVGSPIVLTQTVNCSLHYEGFFFNVPFTVAPLQLPRDTFPKYLHICIPDCLGAPLGQKSTKSLEEEAFVVVEPASFMSS